MIWARVRLGGERGVDVAREYGYRDGAGVSLVVKRLEEAAQRDRVLGEKLSELKKMCKELTPISEISDDSEAKINKALLEQKLPLDETPFDLGEVSFHYGWTFHRAGANKSDRPRRVMTVIYMD